MSDVVGIIAIVYGMFSIFSWARHKDPRHEQEMTDFGKVVTFPVTTLAFIWGMMFEKPVKDV